MMGWGDCPSAKIQEKSWFLGKSTWMCHKIIWRSGIQYVSKQRRKKSKSKEKAKTKNPRWAKLTLAWTLNDFPLGAFLLTNWPTYWGAESKGEWQAGVDIIMKKGVVASCFWRKSTDLLCWKQIQKEKPCSTYKGKYRTYTYQNF